MPAFFTTETDSPWHNLAVERYLLERLIRGEGPHASSEKGRSEGRGEGTTDHALLVWRNSQCVVIGRHQNPWIECDLGRMAAEAVPLIRRISGGGAVYHDRGNTNFTFIGADSTYSLDRQFNVVITALNSLGVSVRRNRRNDLLVGDRKISGNAFRHTRGRSLHHGTLLVSADLEKLTAYLWSPDAPAATPGRVRHPGASGDLWPAGAGPGPAIISSKGIPSVRTRVMNLSDISGSLTHAILIEALRAAYRAEYGLDRAPGLVRPEDDPDSDPIALFESELRSWEWRFGMTPIFFRRVTVGESGQSTAGEMMVTIRHGRVENVTFAHREPQGPGAHPVKGAPDGSAGADRDIVGAVRAAEALLRGVRYVREEILAMDTGTGAVSEIVTAIADAADPEMPPV